MSYLKSNQIKNNNSNKRGFGFKLFSGVMLCLVTIAPLKADHDSDIWGNDNPYHNSSRDNYNHDNNNSYNTRNYDRDYSNQRGYDNHFNFENRSNFENRNFRSRQDRNRYDSRYDRDLGSRNIRNRDYLSRDENRYRDDYRSRTRRPQFHNANYRNEFNLNRRSRPSRLEDIFNRQPSRNQNNYDSDEERNYRELEIENNRRIQPQRNNSQVDLQNKVLGRYSNPVVVRFVQNVSSQQAITVYREVSKMIDNRHIQPTSYAKRTNRALRNLNIAVSNRIFHQALRLNANQQQVSAFQNSINSAIRNNQPRNASEAQNLMYSVMRSGQSQMGLKPSAVVAEFIFGSIDTLDKYSAFEPEDVFRQPSASSLDESIVGIGVEIKPHEKGVKVMKALRGGPASKIGLKAGDLIVGINGRSLKGKNMNAIADMISGPAGSSLNIAVDRNGRIINPITLTRQRIRVYSVSEFRMIDNREKVAYIKLDKFAKSSSSEMDQALWAMHKKGMKSLIIDLRGNPGGLLTTAIELSNKFLPSGAIVSTRGRNQQDNSAEYATKEQTWKTPLVVLVDENSASASEIFAAAIQENQRGIVVGRKSYGKGTVQTHFPLQSVTGNLRLTTAKFYSPKGRQMAGAGVTPDFKIRRTDEYIVSSQSNDRDIIGAVRIANDPQLRSLANTFRNRTPRSSELPAEEKAAPEEMKVVTAQ